MLEDIHNALGKLLFFGAGIQHTRLHLDAGRSVAGPSPLLPHRRPSAYDGGRGILGGSATNLQLSKVLALGCGP